MTAARLLFLAVLAVTTPTVQAGERETIHVLRSVREPAQTDAKRCQASRTGFEPYAQDAERRFSFWSIEVRASDGKVTDADVQRVAELDGCFGPTSDRARQNFFADIRLGDLRFHGRGECQALELDTPEPGLIPVRCHLILSGLPAPYSGGLLTTNTLTSKAAFGGETDPAGYTQASIATLRLWRAQ